jgi:hypothetical protein
MVTLALGTFIASMVAGLTTSWLFFVFDGGSVTVGIRSLCVSLDGETACESYAPEPALDSDCTSVSGCNDLLQMFIGFIASAVGAASLVCAVLYTWCGCDINGGCTVGIHFLLAGFGAGMLVMAVVACQGLQDDIDSMQIQGLPVGSVASYGFSFYVALVALVKAGILTLITGTRVFIACPGDCNEPPPPPPLRYSAAAATPGSETAPLLPAASAINEAPNSLNHTKTLARQP